MENRGHQLPESAKGKMYPEIRLVTSVPKPVADWIVGEAKEKGEWPPHFLRNMLLSLYKEAHPAPVIRRGLEVTNEKGQKAVHIDSHPGIK